MAPFFRNRNDNSLALRVQEVGREGDEFIQGAPSDPTLLTRVTDAAR
jgi:hypothetical protein